MSEPYQRVPVDILKGETNTPAFLAKNPNGKTPVVQLDDGTCLAESNAILYYLADGTLFLPADRLARAQVMQWMFFEQYSHEPFIATSRLLAENPRGAQPPGRSPRRKEGAGRTRPGGHGPTPRKPELLRG